MARMYAALESPLMLAPRPYLMVVRDGNAPDQVNRSHLLNGGRIGKVARARPSVEALLPSKSKGILKTAHTSLKRARDQ